MAKATRRALMALIEMYGSLDETPRYLLDELARRKTAAAVDDFTAQLEAGEIVIV